MVIDSSAIIAIVDDEPEQPAFADAIVRDARRLVSAATWVEVGIVAEGDAGVEGAVQLELLVAKMELSIVPFDREQANVARRAWRRYGKGNHPAALNLGDCFSYALSVVTGEPLLFKGEDFARTDVPAVFTD